jgi:hypothetical protein
VLNFEEHTLLSWNVLESIEKEPARIDELPP